MSGPDPKRMYLAIISQNINSLKAEKPYWSKNFVSANATGKGPKYTALQASMILQKMKVVEFFIDQPSIDLEVKSTDGKSTLIIAVESKMPVSILERLLLNYDLKLVNEADPSGNSAIDYATPGSDVYDFLHSMGCKTRQEKEQQMVGFFGDDVKGSVPGVSAQQKKQHRKAEGAERRRAGGSDSDSATPRCKMRDKKPEQSQSGRVSNDSEPESESHQDSEPWRRFDSLTELEEALEAYIDEWGDDHLDGSACAKWLRALRKARDSGKEQKLLDKWNSRIEKQKTEKKSRNANISEDEGSPQSPSGEKSKDASSNGASPRAGSVKSGSIGGIDPAIIKEFFEGKAGDQVHLKAKGKVHRLTFVVNSHSAREDTYDRKGQDISSKKEERDTPRRSSERPEDEKEKLKDADISSDSSRCEDHKKKSPKTKKKKKKKKKHQNSDSESS